MNFDNIWILMLGIILGYLTVEIDWARLIMCVGVM